MTTIEDVAKWHEGEAAKYEGIRIARAIEQQKFHTDAAKVLREAMGALEPFAKAAELHRTRATKHPRQHVNHADFERAARALTKGTSDAE